MNSKTRYRHPLLNAVAGGIPTLATARVICPDVQPFETDCRSLLAAALQNPLEIRAVQGGLWDLQALFIDWFEQAPPACRRHFAPKQFFVCGWVVYYETYQQLAKVEQRIIKHQLRQGEASHYRGMTFGQLLKEGR